MDFNAILAQSTKAFCQYALEAMGAVITLIIGFWIIGWITRIVKNAMEKRDWYLCQFQSSIVNIGLKVLLLLSVAGMFWHQVTLFIAIFSAGFYSRVGSPGQPGQLRQRSVYYQNHKLGDFIRHKGHAGTVKVQIFFTVLQLLDMAWSSYPTRQVTSSIRTLPLVSAVMMLLSASATTMISIKCSGHRKC